MSLLNNIVRGAGGLPLDVETPASAGAFPLSVWKHPSRVRGGMLGGGESDRRLISMRTYPAARRSPSGASA